MNGYNPWITRAAAMVIFFGAALASAETHQPVVGTVAIGLMLLAFASIMERLPYD